PKDIVNEYGTDALRYFLLREVGSFEDSPFTLARFKDAYNSGLANGLGNLSSRILTLSEKYLDKCPEIPEKSDFTEYFAIYETFDLKKAIDYVWEKIGELDKTIQATEPFKVVKVDRERTCPVFLLSILTTRSSQDNLVFPQCFPHLYQVKQLSGFPLAGYKKLSSYLVTQCLC
ncbi:MAG: class I tRNA ligase family protein, partial [Candidatus Nomurabacteria bacterium]|nr:class I tRNA ligase family protein [Candidatus Nomurabacteria bacterium]